MFKQLENQAPMLSGILKKSVALRKSSENVWRNNRVKTKIGMVLAILLNSKKPRRAHFIQSLVSLQLYRGGLRSTVYKSLSNVGICLTHKWTLSSLEKLKKEIECPESCGSDTDEELAVDSTKAIHTDTHSDNSNKESRAERIVNNLSRANNTKRRLKRLKKITCTKKTLNNCNVVTHTKQTLKKKKKTTGTKQTINNSTKSTRTEKAVQEKKTEATRIEQTVCGNVDRNVSDVAMLERDESEAQDKSSREYNMVPPHYGHCFSNLFDHSYCRVYRQDSKELVTDITHLCHENDEDGKDEGD